MVFQRLRAVPAHDRRREHRLPPPKIKGGRRRRSASAWREAAELLDLEDHLDRKPAKLSGGQRQRVAMGRAIVREPRVFLMDEPLSNLDAKLRVQTRTQIAGLQQRLGVTTVYVTHDQVEAMTMGDRVAVLNDGVLQQCDTPQGCSTHPTNVFVAGFIGSPAMNLREGKLTESGVAFNGYEIPVTRDVLKAAGQDKTVMIGFRPESVDVVGTDENGIDVVVNLVEELGADAFLFAKLPGTDSVVHGADFVARLDTRHIPERGQKVRLRVRPDEVHVFSAETDQRLN